MKTNANPKKINAAIARHLDVLGSARWSLRKLNDGLTNAKSTKGVQKIEDGIDAILKRTRASLDTSTSMILERAGATYNALAEREREDLAKKSQREIEKAEKKAAKIKADADKAKAKKAAAKSKAKKAPKKSKAPVGITAAAAWPHPAASTASPLSPVQTPVTMSPAAKASVAKNGKKSKPAPKAKKTAPKPKKAAPKAVKASKKGPPVVSSSAAIAAVNNQSLSGLSSRSVDSSDSSAY